MSGREAQKKSIVTACCYNNSNSRTGLLSLTNVIVGEEARTGNLHSRFTFLTCTRTVKID